MEVMSVHRRELRNQIPSQNEQRNMTGTLYTAKHLEHKSRGQKLPTQLSYSTLNIQRNCIVGTQLNQIIQWQMTTGNYQFLPTAILKTSYTGIYNVHEMKIQMRPELRRFSVKLLHVKVVCCRLTNSKTCAGRCWKSHGFHIPLAPIRSAIRFKVQCV